MFDSTQLSSNSIQLYHLELDGGQCELAKPDPKLEQLISFYWLLTITDETLDLEVIPDIAVDLVVSPDITSFAALYFPVNQKFHIPLCGPVRYSGVCFKSDSVADFFNVELHYLRALSVGLNTIQTLSIEDLVDNIQGVVTIDKCAQIFDLFFLKRLSKKNFLRPQKLQTTPQNLLKLLQQSVGANNIQSVCNTLQISERQFRRLSDDLFGLSPKKLQNVLRLQATVAELLSDEQFPTQDLFYDDSHRIRELKRLTGMTPGEIRRMAEMYNQS